METVFTDVLVVGAGPVGLTTSALLARYGIDAITVTKNNMTHPTPRAVFVNQRSVEVFRELGFEDEVVRVGMSVGGLGNNVWATSFSGVELARIRAWGTGWDRVGEYGVTSPCGIVNAPQHVLEPVLLEGAVKAGARVCFGHEVVWLREEGGCVRVGVVDRGCGVEYEVRAGFVVGADGARSVVAREVGVGYEDDSGVLNWAVNVWLDADLTEYCAHRPSPLYWIYRPGDPFHCTTWICVRPWTEWVMALVYPPVPLRV